MIQSDLQNCLEAWSKSLEHPVKDRMSHKKKIVGINYSGLPVAFLIDLKG